MQHSVAVDTLNSDIGIAEDVNILHELLHAKSFSVLDANDGEVTSSRSGLKIPNEIEGIRYLGKIDEALNAEINHQIFKKNVEKNPLYKEEVGIFEKIKPWIEKVLKEKGFDKVSRENFLENIYTVTGGEKLLKILEGAGPEEYKNNELWKVLKNQHKDYRLAAFERPKEWEEFNKLINKIIVKSAEKESKDGKRRYRNRWEVIYDFAKPKFTGNLSPLRRNIEEILGRDHLEL